MARAGSVPRPVGRHRGRQHRAVNPAGAGRTPDTSFRRAAWKIDRRFEQIAFGTLNAAADHLGRDLLAPCFKGGDFSTELAVYICEIGSPKIVERRCFGHL
jgi:hypothetical protein